MTLGEEGASRDRRAVMSKRGKKFSSRSEPRAAHCAWISPQRSDQFKAVGQSNLRARMETAHRRLSDACVLVSRVAGALEVACAEYEAAELTVKRWCVRVDVCAPLRHALSSAPVCRSRSRLLSFTQASIGV